MKIGITHCRNIESADLSLDDNKLNIRYGINGTGKSTLAESIEYKVLNPQQLQSLKPFLHANHESIKPDVIFSTTPSDVLTYNEKYVSQYLFQNADEIMEHSFEAFFTPKDYKNQVRAIDQLLQSINQISSTATIAALVTFQETISGLLKLSKSAKTANSVTPGSKINLLKTTGDSSKNVPSSLSSLAPLVTGNSGIKWASWHSSGEDFVKTSGIGVCPYCAQPITPQATAAINSISRLYPKESLDTYKKTDDAFSAISLLLSSVVYAKVTSILNKASPDTSDIDYLKDIFLEAQTILDKTNGNQMISYKDFADSSSVSASLNSRFIDLSNMKYFQGKQLVSDLSAFNAGIKNCQQQVSNLQKEIGSLNSSLRKSASDNLDLINSFLEISGIEYKVIIVDGEGGQHLCLCPKSQETMHVEPNDALSYGEKNAFALALFSLDAKNKPNDALIILDDPISSYDENKKYAIIHFLFSKKQILKDRTVLLLTHDFSTIVGLFMASGKQLPSYVSAYHLENIHGKIKEKPITKADIVPVVQMHLSNVENASLNIFVRLVHLREFFEITDPGKNQFSDAYIVLSNVLKGRNPAMLNETTPMDPSGFEHGCTIIKSYISEFDYADICSLANDDSKMVKAYDEAKENYEKIIIYRVINEIHHFNMANEVKNYIDQTFHIESSYLFELNPTSFCSVPDYLVLACDAQIKTIPLP
jgi:energy-coupling factor transporter ATP-binding protein EcfA2